jgi:hypothetical protein
MNLERLIQLNSEQNQGRGISVVKAIIGLIQLGKVEEAKRFFEYDLDKIRNYPEIIAELETLGLIEKYMLFG